MVPDSRIFLALVMLSAAAATHAADDDQELRARLSACQSMVDSTRRLTCFDALSDHAMQSTAPALSAPRSVVPISSSPTVLAPVPSPAAPAKDSSFGAEAVPVATDNLPKILNARANENFDGIRKGQQITLDNGQVWISVDDRSYDYEGNAPDVSIERNFIGNYWMKLSDSSFRFRVRRIK